MFDPFIMPLGDDFIPPLEPSMEEELEEQAREDGLLDEEDFFV